MIESLGAGDGFRAFYTALAKKYPIRLIRIKADLETCLARVRKRDNTQHIPVSDEKVMEYNRIASQVTYDWDLEIDNSDQAEDRVVLDAIRELDTRASRA